MGQDNGLELKVGAFVLLAVAALTFFVLSVSDTSMLQKGQHLEVVFGYASGLREAAPVRLAGVDVGLVKKLQVFLEQDHGRQTKVKITAWIKGDVAIPADSRVTINQLGILGEKYLEILPGTSAQTIKDGGVIIGHDPVPIEKITEKVDDLISKLGTTVDNINSGILTATNEKSLEAGLEGFGVLGQDLKEGRGTLGKLLRDDSIYNNLDEMTLDLKGNPWKLLYRPKSK